MRLVGGQGTGERGQGGGGHHYYYFSVFCGGGGEGIINMRDGGQGTGRGGAAVGL